MANNNVQAQEIESLNMNEAFFMKYKKAIMIAVVASIVIVRSAQPNTRFAFVRLHGA